MSTLKSAKMSDKGYSYKSSGTNNQVTLPRPAFLFPNPDTPC